MDPIPCLGLKVNRTKVEGLQKTAFRERQGKFVGRKNRPPTWSPFYKQTFIKLFPFLCPDIAFLRLWLPLTFLAGCLSRISKESNPKQLSHKPTDNL